MYLSKKVIYLKHIYFILIIVQIYNIFTDMLLETDIKMIIKLYLNCSTTCAQCIFLNIKPNMYFNVAIDEDCMIYE